MKKISLSKLFLAYILFWSSHALAGDYVYTDLLMKNYDEMQADVKTHIADAEQIADEDIDQAKAKLKDALRLIFSRPNTDNMVSQLVPAARTPLRNVEAYEKTVQEIADSAIAVVNNKKSSKSAVGTGIIVLTNIMSELKPDLKTNKTVQAIFNSIRDAKIKVDKKVSNELRMRAMIKVSKSPSELAKETIDLSK